MSEKTSIKPIVVPLKNSIYSCIGNEISINEVTTKNTTNDTTKNTITSTTSTTSITTKNTIKNDSAPLEICLFVKDPQREYKDLIFNELSLNNSSTGTNQSFKIAKIIDISKLRKKYKEFESKRILCNSFDLFLADERVLPLLPKLLGKYFFNKKKLPVAINLTRKSAIKSQIDSIMNGSIMHPNKGTCWSLKIGTTVMSQSTLCENALTGIMNGVDKIPKKWDNIISIHIKTENSIALPLYQQLPDHPLKEDMVDAEMEDTEMKDVLE